MSDATLVLNRDYEKYQTLNIKAKFYDDIFALANIVGGSNEIGFLTQSELDTIGYTPTRHPLGQCPFYFGRTGFNIDANGRNLYHWSTTDYNIQTARYEYTTLPDGSITPAITGWGGGFPEFVEGLEGGTLFYFEDLDMGSIPTPDGYYYIDDLIIPYWNNWPGTDFYGRQKTFHIIGDKICRLTAEGPRPFGTKWSRLPEAVSAGTFGTSRFYWVPESRKVPFTDTLHTVNLFRFPKGMNGPAHYLLPGDNSTTPTYWNPKTDQYFYSKSRENELTRYYVPISNNGDLGKFNSLPNDQFFIDNNLGFNFVRVLNRYSPNQDDWVHGLSPRHYVQPTIFNTATHALNSNQYTLNNDVYFDFGYTFKNVALNSGRITVTQFDQTGYTSSVGYQVANPALESSSSEVFQLNKKRLTDSYVMVEETPMDILISGSVIRNKNLFYNNGKLDLDMVYQNASIFFNVNTGEQIGFSDAQSLRHVNKLTFRYRESYNGKNYEEDVNFYNDQQYNNAPLYKYDYDVTILNNGSYDYYSDNTLFFDGGGPLAFTGSGTMKIINSNNNLWFDGSGTVNGITLDTYQTSRANIKAITTLPSGNSWRNNHLSPLINLNFIPNSGLIERPQDTFHTIQDMVSDNNRLFVVGNRVGVLSKLTVNNSGEYADKVYKYNAKISECL